MIIMEGTAMGTRQYYPAMEEQKGFIKFFKLIPIGGHNICARVDFDTLIDAALMEKALKLAFSRLPYCNIRLHKERKELLMYFSEEEPIIEPLVDLSAYSSDEVQAYYEKLCKKGLTEPPFDAQLYKLCPAILADKKYSLLFISSHLITDGYSQMYALIYAFKTYSALKNNTELPTIGLDPLPYIEKDTELLHSPRMKEDAEWWKEELKTKLHFTSINGLGSPEFIKKRTFGKAMTPKQTFGKSLIYQEKIPEIIVKQVENAAKINSLSPQIYYMLALRSYLSYYCETDDVLFYSTLSRRGNHQAKHCGLMLANILPFRSIISGELSCIDALKELKRIQLRSYRHSTTDINMTKKIIKKQQHLPPFCTFESIWFTYQPFYDFNETELKFRGQPVHNGVSSTPLYIYIMPVDSSEDLWAEYFYCEDYVKKENLERFHGFMLRFLDFATKHPDYSISELIKLSL